MYYMFFYSSRKKLLQLQQKKKKQKNLNSRAMILCEQKIILELLRSTPSALLCFVNDLWKKNLRFFVLLPILFFRAIEIDSNNQVFYCNRAAAHSKMNNHYAAVEDCKRAIDMDPNYGKAYGRMGLGKQHALKK